MALDDIKKEIDKESEARAQAIAQEWNNKLAIAQAEWKEKIDAKKQTVLGIAQNKATQKIQQTEFKLNSGRQSVVLKSKQKLMENVFEQAEQELFRLKDDDYVDLMESLIKKLPNTAGELISVKERQDLLKKALKKSGKDFKLAEATIGGRGGFIFRSTKVEIDQTFTALVNQTKEESAIEISKILFS